MQITCDFPDQVLPIGTKVFLPRAALHSVQEDEITGYSCIMSDIEGKLTIFPTDYRLHTCNVSRDSLAPEWKRNEFFLSYEEALTMAKEYHVVAAKELWLTAIGLDGSEDEERIHYDDKCELESCCANISAIRDVLYEACVEGKIDAVTRASLKELLNSHEPPSPKPVLDKILAQLNLVWTNEGAKEI